MLSWDYIGFTGFRIRENYSNDWILMTHGSKAVWQHDQYIKVKTDIVNDLVGNF